MRRRLPHLEMVRSGLRCRYPVLAGRWIVIRPRPVRVTRAKYLGAWLMMVGQDDVVRTVWITPMMAPLPGPLQLR